MGFDAANIIIQYHLFLALCLVVAGSVGAVFRSLTRKRTLPELVKYPEFIIMAILVIAYVVFS